MMLEPELPGGREDVHPGARTETLTAAHPGRTIRAEQPLGLGAEASRIPLKNNSDHVAVSAAPGDRLVLGIDVPKPGPHFAERGPDSGDPVAAGRFSKVKYISENNAVFCTVPCFTS